MAKQGSLMLFPEIEQVTQKMSDEQFGKLIRAAFAYRFRGETYSGDDVSIDIAFQFISNQIDRGEAVKAARSKAACMRWDQEKEANEYAHMQNDANEYSGECTNSKHIQMNTPIQSTPIQSDPVPSGINEGKADEPPTPPKQVKKPFGEFGWVKLTDDEYNRLLNDFGEAEVKRCITYVDESAQSTANKNKWRDWNLVVRKCHKQGWGINQGQYGKPQRTQKQGGRVYECL